MGLLQVLYLVVLLQLLTVATQFTTLNRLGLELGGDPSLLGFLWAAYALPRAISGPLLSGLSDKIGRRPLMLLGGLATVASSLVWAMSQSFEMLIASRLVDSMLAGHSIVAFAVAADITKPQRRAATMGLLGTAVGVAFIVGPKLGEVFSREYGLHAVGLLNAALATVGVALTLLLLRETRPIIDAPIVAGDAPHTSTRSSVAVPQLSLETSFPTVLLDDNDHGRFLFGARRVLMYVPIAVVLLFSLLWTTGYTHINTAFELSSNAWFGFGANELSWAWVILGATGVLAQGVLLGFLVRWLGDADTSALGALLGTVGFALMATGWSPVWLFAGVTLVGLGAGLAFGASTGLLSRLASPERQGLILGLGQTAQHIGRGLGPVFGAKIFAAWGASAPFASAGAMALACAVGLAVVARVYRLQMGRK